ncbi:MAG TPA: hypothetical protein VF228_01570 [Iamia sp.]
MSRFMAWYGLWVWVAVMAVFFALSAIPPGIALYRRSSETRFVISLVGIPMALTVYFALTLPVWVICWIVALGIAIWSPGLESRAETRRREAAVLRSIADGTQGRRVPPVTAPTVMGDLGGGVPRAAWGGGRPSPSGAPGEPSPPQPTV